MPSPKQFSVLLLDSHEDSLISTAEFLAQEGFEVLQARNLRTAEEIAASREVDLLICELERPPETLLDRLRPRRGAIALSSRGVSQEQERCLRSGFQAFLLKPCTGETLLESIRRVLG